MRGRARGRRDRITMRAHRLSVAPAFCVSTQTLPARISSALAPVATATIHAFMARDRSKRRSPLGWPLVAFLATSGVAPLWLLLQPWILWMILSVSALTLLVGAFLTPTPAHRPLTMER